MVLELTVLEELAVDPLDELLSVLLLLLVLLLDSLSVDEDSVLAVLRLDSEIVPELDDELTSLLCDDDVLAPLDSELVPRELCELSDPVTVLLELDEELPLDPPLLDDVVCVELLAVSQPAPRQYPTKP